MNSYRAKLDLPVWILTGFYIFYNVLIYGFFMGFPVSNLAMGVVAGYYFGIKIKSKNISQTQSEIIKKQYPLLQA